MQKVKIVAGSASIELATKIAKEYRTKLGHVTTEKFSDKEMCPTFDESIRGTDIYIVQSTPPPGDNWMELFLLIDAAKRASANRVIAVLPYFGYSRQDKKDKPRVAIGAKLVANLLTAAGIDRLLTMDLHAGQIQGFFDIPVDSLFASQVFIPYIHKLKDDGIISNLCIATPDVGGAKRAAKYADGFDCDLAIIFKQRAKANVISKMSLIGDVKNKDVILIDDLIDTGGTLCKASDLLMESGAKSVRAFCTHPVLSGAAYENIERSSLVEMVVTDTVPLKQKTPKIKVISVAILFADVISRIQNNESISTHFDFNKLF